jgi:hypothetical protein
MTRNIIPYAPNEKSTVGIDAERLRASIAKLTSSSTNELEKLIAELEALKTKRRPEENNKDQTECPSPSSTIIISRESS